MKLFKWFDLRMHKLQWFDMALIKLSSACFGLLIAKLWPTILILDWPTYLLLTLIFAVYPIYRYFFNK